MPTKRTRVTNRRQNTISDCALHYATDGLWGVEQSSEFESLTYRYPTVSREPCRAVWLAIRDDFLPEWIQRHPGTRPSWWFLFDGECPRISAEDVKRYGWEGCYFTQDLPDLRRRLGGIGDPQFEHLSLVPRLHCAVPVDFVTAADVEEYLETDEPFDGKPIDEKNPPVYESQAAYLRRNKLLTREEARRLKPKDFEPITIETPKEEGK